MRLLLNPRYTSTLPEGINYYYKAPNIYSGEYSNQQATTNNYCITLFEFRPWKAAPLHPPHPLYLYET